MGPVPHMADAAVAVKVAAVSQWAKDPTRAFLQSLE